MAIGLFKIQIEMHLLDKLEYLKISGFGKPRFLKKPNPLGFVGFSGFCHGYIILDMWQEGNS